MSSGRVPAPAVGTRLAEPDNALAGLLESLLAEVPAVRPGDGSSPADASPLRSDEAVSESGGTPPEQVRVSEPASVDRAAKERPAWAGTGGFSVLSFRVSGQWIAAPLVSLRRIERLDQPLRRLPGQDGKRCGVALLRGESIPVFDLGRLLGLSAHGRPEPGGYLVVAGDGRQAFYCDEMGATRSLAEHDVRWARTGAPRWLAGVVADDLSVLVDVARLFETGGHE